MIIFFVLMLISIASGASANKLMNNDFTTEIINNGVILNNKYKLKYDLLKENDKVNNNYKKLYFDNINYGQDYSINSISSLLKDDNLTVNFIYETVTNYTVFVNDMKKLVKYEDNKLYVSMYINEWNFKKYNNNLTLDFSINTNTILNNNTISFNNFKIDFNDYGIVDGHHEDISILKESNKYKIIFPYFEDHLYYNFIISYE
jgi:hypothetical protein